MGAGSRTTILEYADIQGLVLRGYQDLPAACFYLLHVNDPAAFKSWLTFVLDERRVTSAASRPSPNDGAFNIAFTKSGLAKLDAYPSPERQKRDGFPPEFREGLTHSDRSRVLGDVGNNDPAFWRWGGPPRSAEDEVDCVCLTYAATGTGATSLTAMWDALSPPSAVARVVTALPTWLSPDGEEPFGFRDGISQPILRYTPRDYATVGPDRDLHVVEPGEFLLGYENESGRMPLSPAVAAERDPKNRLRPLEYPPRLDARAFDPNLRDFGRNGTYLVMRQLWQHVDAFGQFLAAVAGPREEEQQLLASRIVGRHKDGTPLARSVRGRDSRDPDNAFAYFGEDRFGYQCPPGAHIRRAFPRDALADPESATGDKAVRRANRHRLLRRGRRYGPPNSPGIPDLPDVQRTMPPGEQGLVFVALAADLRRQFEFVQQTWLQNDKFAGLHDERDPLTGPAGTFTVRQCEAGHVRVDVPQLVTVVGGAYFFMPGLSALRCLADG